MPGARQRAAAAAAADAEQADVCHGVGSSCLISLVVGLWSWGLMSPQLVQQIAHAALRDLDKALESQAGADSLRIELDNIASMGTYGRYKNKCNHDLKCKLPDSQLELSYMRIPLRCLGAGAHATVWAMKQSMLLPHVLFSCLGNLYPSAFAKLMCPSIDRVTEFWGNMRDNPQLKCD